MDNYKIKYLKYKKKYLKLKNQIGGNNKVVNYISNQFPLIDYNSSECEFSIDHDDAYYCRNNRSQCLQLKDIKNKNYELELNQDLQVNKEEYDFYRCRKNDKPLDIEIIQKTYNIIIIGAGPVGLITGIIAKNNFDQKVLIIELRESYSREEIFMLRNDTNFETITLLKDIGVLTKIISERHGCYIDDPFNTVGKCNIINEETKLQKNLLENLEELRISIRIKNLQFILEEKFIEMGGELIRAIDNKKENQIDFNLIGKTITIDKNFFLLTNNSININKKGSKFNYTQQLFCADGTNSNTRDKFNPNGFKLTFFTPQVTRTSLGANFNEETIMINKENKTNMFWRYISSVGIILHLDLSQDDIEKSKTNIIRNQSRYRLFTTSNYNKNKLSYGAIQITKDEFSYILASIHNLVSKNYPAFRNEDSGIFEWNKWPYHFINKMLTSDFKLSNFSLDQVIDGKYPGSYRINYSEFFKEETIKKILFPLYEKRLKEVYKDKDIINEIKKLMRKIFEKFTDLIKNFFKFYNIKFDENKIIQLKMFPITLYTMEKFWDSYKGIVWTGDASLGVNFLSGSGVNIGIKNGNDHLKNLTDPEESYKINKKLGNLILLRSSFDQVNNLNNGDKNL